MAHVFFRKTDSLNGALIYALGDGLATLITGEFLWTRTLGMALVGGTVYAFEVPNVFHWIHHMSRNHGRVSAVAIRTCLAIAYFSPIWVARHFLFIKIFGGMWDEISWMLLWRAAQSFGASVPVLIVGNAVVQGALPIRHRFVGASIFSGLLALYYAISEVWLS